MIDKSTRKQLAERKERVRRRINTKVDPENYEFIPAKKPIDYYDNDIRQRVAVYARVSTDNVQQTSSYELQKKYYEDFVVHHPNWTLVKIYADEGISGTSLAHRDEFNSMIADCRSGKIDMIITKSVSRFARNVVDCISMVRMLAELPSPVGVFFESECIFSLKDDSQMALSFQATMAQEESHIRSRSMETSLRMRLDGGLPLTPKLLGYSVFICVCRFMQFTSIIFANTTNTTMKAESLSEFLPGYSGHLHAPAKPQQISPFTGLITCAICGKHYRRKTTATGPVWICSTYNSYGKSYCPSKAVPEEKLMQTAALVGHTGEITAITAHNDNLLEFTLKDGTNAVKRWQDRSRAESWTAEMRRAAGEKTRERKLRHAES